jgi:hypothetical protein
MEDEEKGEAKHVEETISEIKRGNEFSNEKVRPSLGDGIFYFSWVACPAGILMTTLILLVLEFKIKLSLGVGVMVFNATSCHWAMLFSR